MSDPFVLFWTAMIWASIAWYSWLLFQVGWHGGVDIIRMMQRLRQEDEADGQS